MIYEAIEIPGSDEYLAHHGILGQKWGVRRFQNPDGTLTVEGKARYFSKRETGKFARKLKRYSDNPNNYDFDRISKTPQIKSVASKVKKSWDTLGVVEKNVGSKLRKTESDFFKRKDYKTWGTKAAQKAYAELDDKTKSAFPFKDFLKAYLSEDYDQGSRENTTKSFDIWVKESGAREAKEYLKNEKKLREAQESYRSECKNAVREFLGKNGDKPAGFTIGLEEDGRYMLRQRTLTEKGADLVSDVLSRSGGMSESKQLELAEELDWN